MENEKLVALARGYGYPITAETLPAFPREKREELETFLTALDAGEHVACPGWLVELGDGPPETPEPTPEQTAIETLTRQVASLQQQLDGTPLLTERQQEALSIGQEIGELSRTVRDAEEEFSQADKTAKAAKKNFEALLLDLQKMSERLDEINSGGDFQRSLFPTGGTSHEITSDARPATEDGGGAISLDDMSKAGLARHGIEAEGLTAKKIEVLKHEVGETLADLEGWLAGGDPSEIEGFGPAWVSRLTEARVALRTKYPMPGDDEAGAAAELDPDDDSDSDGIEMDEPEEDTLIDELEDELATAEGDLIAA